MYTDMLEISAFCQLGLGFKNLWLTVLLFLCDARPYSGRSSIRQ